MMIRSKVLIVDDSHAMALLTKYYLEAFGLVSVHAAMDAKWALEEIINVSETSDRYDLIICNYQMNYYNGLDLLKEVRGSEDIEYTKFLMTTPIGDKKAVEISKQAGADACLEKPFAEVDLIEKIVNLFADPSVDDVGQLMSDLDTLRKANG